jgi:hypothetical protein
LVRARTELRLVGAVSLGVAILATGCARPEEAFFCPDAGEGELIVTEIRGPQTGDDTWGQWIELHNPTDRDYDLFGLRITMRPLDGDAPDVVLVRTEEVELPAGGYAVLGRFSESNLPAHIDYGFDIDLDGDLLSSAILEVKACGVVTDRVIYRQLPDQGTRAFDGALAPDAEANDDETRWCDDATEPTAEQAQTMFGIPGTPGEANRPCV